VRTTNRSIRGRRQLLKTMGSSIAAVAIAPPLAGAAQHPGHGQHLPPGSAGGAPASQSVPAWQPSLSGHERATLETLGEQVVPGSTAAGAPALIDRYLAAEQPEVLRRFRNALAAFEREARTRHTRPWLQLTIAERTALLQEAATGAPAVPPAPGWRPGMVVLRPRPMAEPVPTLRDHFDQIKGLVARAYYATEHGATELGWTGNEIWEGLPGCKS
jgi:hypothetical protein